MALETRPLDFGDRIGAAFKLYQANFVTFITITAVIVAPLQLLSIVLGAALGRELPVDPETGIVDVEAVDAGTLWAYAAAIAATGLITVIGSLLATAGVMKAAANDAVGRTTDWQDSLGFAVGKLGRLIATLVLVFLGVAGTAIGGILVTGILFTIAGPIGLIGLVATVAAVVWLAVAWALWVPAVVLEGRSATAALGRSNDLVSGRWWPVMGYLIVIALLVGVINAVAGGLIAGIGAAFSDPAGTVLRAAATIALAVVTAPIYASALIALYFDQRVRTEGADAIVADLVALDDGPFGSLPPDQHRPPDEPPPIDGV